MGGEQTEFTEDELRTVGLNPHPTCWSDSGITLLERMTMRLVAQEYPDGAYAAFVLKMDQGELTRKDGP